MPLNNYMHFTGKKGPMSPGKKRKKNHKNPQQKKAHKNKYKTIKE